MLATLKTVADVERLEKSGRLLRRPFLPGLIQVAALDVGQRLRLARPQDAAPHFASLAAAWAHIDAALDARLQAYALVGSVPFWFLDCEDWPGAAFLAAPAFSAWAKAHLGADRPLMAASFSAEQLLIGYADSAEFHDRLGHVRQAPAQRPLAPYPFLVQDGLLPIARIELHLGDHVSFHPQDPTRPPQKVDLS